MRGPVIILVLLAAAALAACGEDPPECTQAHEGDLTFAFDPQLPAPPDSASNLTATLNGATLNDVLRFPGSDPPVIIYRFRTPSYNRLDMIFRDLGTDLPLAIDSTYTLMVDMTRGLVPPSMGLKILDGEGLRYLGVNDWYPSGDSRAKVFKNGYGDLGDDGALRVFLSNTGCDPRVENTSCYLSITNRRLDFILGDRSRVGRYNGEEAVIGSWRFHVHKAEVVIGKQGCLEALEGQNGVSFFAERAGLR